MSKRNQMRLHLEPLEDRCLPSFSPAVMYPTGAIPGPVLTADFNGDERLDLAVTNHGSSTVSVLLGNPDGTFQPAQSSATGTGPGSLAVGDFNEDGKLDLATANSGDPNSFDDDVSILLGNGDGSFQPPTSFGRPLISPTAVAVGDFNADGHLDLGVTTVYEYGGYFGGGAATVLLGHGDGSFAEPSSAYLGEGQHFSAALADFNGDGHLDFASDAEVVFGDGTGAFGSPVSLPAGSGSSVIAEDVNADNKIDLVTTGFNSVGVLLGTGLGSFAAPQYYRVSEDTSPWVVAVADFNGDGKVDLVTANTFRTVSVLLGDGTGSFGAAQTFTVDSGAGSLAVGDFNGDLFPDLAVAGQNVSVLLNDQSWPPIDAPAVSLRDVSVTEGNTGTVSVTFTVSLSVAYSQAVKVDYATADGTATAASGDYQAASGTLTFGIGETSKPITVLINGDRLPESTEWFFLRLSNPINAIITDATGMGTMTDDEPRLTINDVAHTEGNSGTNPFTFTVSFLTAYDVPVTVDFATGDGSATASSDYQGNSGTLIIPAGQTTGTITVLVNGDRLGELNETFFVDLSNINYGVIADQQGVGTIVEDEPRISISDMPREEGRKGKTTLFTFTVALSAAYDEPVTVSYRTVDGTATTGDGDYVAKTGTLIFLPGETTKIITIEVKGDRKMEANETFTLELFGASSNALLLDGSGLGTILNDD